MNVQSILNSKAMEAETIRGIISERDIVTNLAKHGASLLDMLVASMMTQPSKPVHPRNPSPMLWKR